MKYKIYADFHIGGPNQLASGYKVTTSGFMDYKNVYLGDNYDLKNCKKSEVDAYKKAWQETLYGKGPWNILVSGNHELSYQKITHTDEKILFTHGDIDLLWPAEKGHKFRSKKTGAGWFKRNFLSRPISWGRALYPFKIKQKHLDRAYELAKQYDCKTIVCGHGHPKKLLRKTYKDVELIVVPRGITEIEL